MHRPADVPRDASDPLLSLFSFFKADFRILVKSPGQRISRHYLRYAIPGIAVMIFFSVVIPAFYFLVLWFLRKRLQVRRLVVHVRDRC